MLSALRQQPGQERQPCHLAMAGERCEHRRLDRLDLHRHRRRRGPYDRRDRNLDQRQGGDDQCCQHCDPERHRRSADGNGVLVTAGTAQEGQTLTAQHAVPSEDDDTLTYQWFRHSVSALAIPGATGATYTATEGDEGHQLDVVVTDVADFGGGTATATSALSSVVLDALPTITTPMITGTAREGMTLSALASSRPVRQPRLHLPVATGRREHRRRHRLYLCRDGRQRGPHDRRGRDLAQRQRCHDQRHQRCNLGSARCLANDHDTGDHGHGPGRPDADGLGRPTRARATTSSLGSGSRTA